MLHARVDVIAWFQLYGSGELILPLKHEVEEIRRGRQLRCRSVFDRAVCDNERTCCQPVDLGGYRIRNLLDSRGLKYVHATTWTY